MGNGEKICEFWGSCNCFAGFEPGGITADGKRIYKTRCAAGITGGCGGSRIPPLTEHVARPVKQLEYRDEFGIVRPTPRNESEILY